MSWHIFIGHAVLSASVVLTACILLLFKKFRSLQRRRSPLHGKQIGHVPGQQLLDRIDKESEEAGFGVDVMMLALPLLFLVWTTLKIDWSRVSLGAAELAFLIGWMMFFSFGLWYYQRHARRREQARDGLLAERVTGMQLNRLVAQGCIVLHDLPSDVGNIDHVVVAPQGVFAIETKSFRKPKGGEENHRVRYDGKALHFPDFVNTDAMAQAERSAQWVQRYLRDKLPLQISVTAALALPGWYIERADSAKGASVRVFTPMGRGAEFLGFPPERLDGGQRSLIAQALALRYPEIAD
jgi:nuclease-like protein